MLASAPLYDPRPLPRAALATLDPPACPAGLLHRLARPQQPECPAAALLSAARALDAALLEVLPGGPRLGGCAPTARLDLDVAWTALRAALATAEV